MGSCIDALEELKKYPKDQIYFEMEEIEIENTGNVSKGTILFLWRKQ